MANLAIHAVEIYNAERHWTQAQHQTERLGQTHHGTPVASPARRSSPGRQAQHYPSRLLLHRQGRARLAAQRTRAVRCLAGTHRATRIRQTVRNFRGITQVSRLPFYAVRVIFGLYAVRTIHFALPSPNPKEPRHDPARNRPPDRRLHARSHRGPRAPPPPAGAAIRGWAHRGARRRVWRHGDPVQPWPAGSGIVGVPVRRAGRWRAVAGASCDEAGVTSEEDEGLMLAIPIKQAGREWLILVMDQNNLDRLQKADPMEFDVGATGLKSPTILLAFARNQAAVARFIQTADLGGLIK